MLVRRAAERGADPMRSGVSLDENVGVLLPGPFRACLPDVLAAAGQPLWKDAVFSARARRGRAWGNPADR